jgi:hypothetical protein
MASRRTAGLWNAILFFAGRCHLDPEQAGLLD